jgi:hypothetical protein
VDRNGLVVSDCSVELCVVHMCDLDNETPLTEPTSSGHFAYLCVHTRSYTIRLLRKIFFSFGPRHI